MSMLHRKTIPGMRRALSAAAARISNSRRYEFQRMSTHDDIERYAQNLRDEIDGAALYAALAAAEKDPVRKDLFLQLAQSEGQHAELWREKLRAAGVEGKTYAPSF